jgi:Gpi18-like mannosyltransferase
MRRFKTTIIVTTIVSVVLLLIGIFSHSLFFALILPRINGVIYQANSITQGFGMALTYSLTIAAIPFVTILVWKQANIRSSTRRVAVPFVLFVCIAIATLLRQYTLKTEIKRHAEITQTINEQNKENILTAISLDKLDIEKYMLLGLFAGIVVAYVSLRQKAYC